MQVIKPDAPTKLKAGDVAVCGKGFTGLILGVDEVNDAVLHTGIHLEDDLLGQKWQSMNPTKIGNISLLLVHAYADSE